MSELIFNREQLRDLDRRAVERYHLRSLVLMENAGRGCADLLCRLGVEGPVVICAGYGDNGGDGLVMARHLDLRGIAVEVFVFPPVGKGTEDPFWDKTDWLSPDTAANFRILQFGEIPIAVVETTAELQVALRSADWVVDALLGTGARGEPRAPLDQVIGTINQSGKRVLAIDVPTGLDCESGVASRSTIRATATCTLVARKPGFGMPSAAPYLGELHVADIGVPAKLIREVAGLE